MAALGFEDSQSEEYTNSPEQNSRITDEFEQNNAGQPEQIPEYPISNSAQVNRRSALKEIAQKVAESEKKISDNIQELRYDLQIEPSPTSQLTPRDLYFKVKKNLTDIVAEDENQSFLNDDLFNEEPDLRFQPRCLIGGLLKKHQIFGLNWLIALFKAKCNGLLADQMGLGKTIQAIGLIAYLREVEKIKRRHLVICPLSVVENWKMEFSQWIPDCKVGIFCARKNKDDDRAMLTERDTRFDVLVTSYQGLTRHKSALMKMKFHYFIIDEAQAIKNSASELAKVAREIDSGYRLLLTGTPLSNTPEDLTNLLGFIMPSIFQQNSLLFKTMFEFRTPQQEAEDGIKRDELVSEIQKLIKPFILRRLKHDTDIELIPKKEVHLMCPMSKLQSQTYKALLVGNYNTGGATISKPNLTTLLARLRQLSVHPYILSDLKPEENSLDRIVEDSGKFRVLDKILDKFVSKEQIKVLIFSQMTTALDVVQLYLEHKGLSFYRLDGQTDVRSRGTQIQQFNDPNNEVMVFLLSTRAGGLGVNLKAASVVVILDSDWNPQVDMQAMDRAHRIGQEKEVRIYRLITKNSVEEKIIERQTAKLKYEFLLLERNRRKFDDEGLPIAELEPYQVDLKKLSESQLLDLAFFGVTSQIRADEVDANDQPIDIEKLLEEGVNSRDRIDEMYNLKIKEYTEKILEFKLDNNYREFVDLVESKPELKLQAFSLDEMRINYFQAEKQRADKEMRAQKVKILENFENEAIRPQPHQLYNDANRLFELRIKQLRYQYCRMHLLELDSSYVLSDEENRELQLLEKSGFGSWSSSDFRKFIKYSAKYSRFNLEDIQTKLNNKTVEELYRYSVKFWACLPYFSDGLEIQEYIRFHEYRDDLRDLYEAKARELLRLVENPFYIEFTPELTKELASLKLTGGAKLSCYLDKYLLWVGCQSDEPNWQSILRFMKSHSWFQYIYVDNFLNEIDLEMRFNILVKKYLNQFEIKWPKFKPKSEVKSFDFAKHFHREFTNDQRYDWLEKEEIFYCIDQGFGKGQTTLRMDWFDGLKCTSPLGINLEPNMFWRVIELAQKSRLDGPESDEDIEKWANKNLPQRLRKRGRPRKRAKLIAESSSTENSLERENGISDLQKPQTGTVAGFSDLATSTPKKRGRPRRLQQPKDQNSPAGKTYQSNVISKSASKVRTVSPAAVEEHRVAQHEEDSSSSTILLGKRAPDPIRVSQRSIKEYFNRKEGPAADQEKTRGADLVRQISSSSVAGTAKPRKERVPEPDITSFVKASSSRGGNFKREDPGSGSETRANPASRVPIWLGPPTTDIILDEFDLESYCRSLTTQTWARPESVSVNTEEGSARSKPVVWTVPRPSDPQPDAISISSDEL